LARSGQIAGPAFVAVPASGRGLPASGSPAFEVRRNPGHDSLGQKQENSPDASLMPRDRSITGSVRRNPELVA